MHVQTRFQLCLGASGIIYSCAKTVRQARELRRMAQQNATSEADWWLLRLKCNAIWQIW